MAIVTGVLLGLGEVAQIFMIDAPVMAAAFALLFLGGAWLARNGRQAGVVVILVLALLELLFLPMYDRKTAGDWIVQAAFGVVSAVALGSSMMALMRYRRGRPAGQGRATPG